MRHRRASDGVDLLEAAFDRHVYERHIHETYAIGFTLRGVQRFWCRGATHDSRPGHVIVIGPGEAHDGRSGAPGGYAYRMFYLSTGRARQILDEAQEQGLGGIEARGPLIADPALSQRLDAAWRAFDRSADSLAADELLRLAVLTLGTPRAARHFAGRTQVDNPALTRVREYLRERLEHPVGVGELAAVASMSRFQLTRQFQQAFGLPLHAYHLHVRLEEAKRRLRCGQSIASVAAGLGFVDQSHLNRRFKGAFGLTPGAWRRCVTST